MGNESVLDKWERYRFLDQIGDGMKILLTDLYENTANYLMECEKDYDRRIDVYVFPIIRRLFLDGVIVNHVDLINQLSDFLLEPRTIDMINTITVMGLDGEAEALQMFIEEVKQKYKR
jgi:hypothetical protein